jgi:tetratricopeptide (TPR) repeat protein
MNLEWWTDGLTEICEQFQLDLSCLVDGELDEPAAVRAMAHLEDCKCCREFFDDTRMQLCLHRDMAEPDQLLERYRALTGLSPAAEIEALELTHRLSTIFYQLGKAYVLSATDPSFRERAFEKAVALDTEQTRGRGFVDGVLSRDSRSNLERGGVDWVHARHMLNGRLAKIEDPLEKGRRLLEEAITVDPSHEEARLYLAYLHSREGKHTRAEKEFRRVFREASLPVNRGHAAVQLAKLYAAEGELRRSLACYRWVRMSGLMETEEKFFVVGFNTAVCYADMRQPERCVEAFRDVLDRFPARVPEVVELFATSVTELRAALESQPDLVKSLYEHCPELFQVPAQDSPEMTLGS